MPYTPLILTSYDDDYPMIRHLLDLDSTDLPNSTIEEYGYLPYVEAEVTSIVTTYTTILSAGGANMYRLKMGVAAWVAALMCQHVASTVSGGGVQIGDYQEKGAGYVEWKDRARDLMGLAAQALAGLTTRTFTRMSLVKLAGPTRSGSNVPDDEEAWLEKIQPRILDWIEEGGEDDD